MSDEKTIVEEKDVVINKHISENIYWLRVLLIYFIAFLTAQLIESMNFSLFLVVLLFLLIIYVLRHNNTKGNIKYDVFLIFNFILALFLVVHEVLFYDRISSISIPIAAGYSLYSLIVYYSAQKNLPPATTLIWKFVLGVSFFIFVPFITYVFIFTIL